MGINSLLPWKNSNVELDKKAFEDFQRRMSTLNDAKVLVVGGGGREHAIVDALSRSSHVGKIYCAPGNAGIAAQAECIPIKDTEIEKLLEFVKEKGVDLTVVGPEASLSAGIVDIFTMAGETIFGPTKAAATTALQYSTAPTPSPVSLRSALYWVPSPTMSWAAPISMHAARSRTFLPI